MPIPLLIGLGIAGATGLGSAISGAVGSANAAAAQESAAERAMRLQREMWEQQRSDMAPWHNGGRTTLGDLMGLMQSGEFDKSFDPSQIANDPGYRFRMAEGQRALERSASARGMLNSGAALKSLARYGQGVASDEYNNAWNRHRAGQMDRFGRLSTLAGYGQNAAQSMGAYNAQHGSQMSNLYGAQGNAQSAGAMGMANAVSGGFNTLGNLATMGMMHGQPGGWGPGSQQQVPTQYGYSTMGYPTQGYGPWR